MSVISFSESSEVLFSVYTANDSIHTYPYWLCQIACWFIKLCLFLGNNNFNTKKAPMIPPRLSLKLIFFVIPRIQWYPLSISSNPPSLRTVLNMSASKAPSDLLAEINKGDFNQKHVEAQEKNPLPSAEGKLTKLVHFCCSNRDM